MKNLVLILLVLALSLTGCTSDEKEESIVFDTGNNLILSYKDNHGVDFTAAITLHDNKDNKSVFSGDVMGKTIEESFVVSGIINHYFAETKDPEIHLRIVGLVVGGKRHITDQKLLLEKKGEIFVSNSNYNKIAHAEIKPFK